MNLDIALLNPQEVTVLLIAVGGIFPVLIFYRYASRLQLLAYGFFLLGAITTNIENLFWYDWFNLLEHSIANLGVGVTFAAIAYLNYKRINETPLDNGALENR